jgi:hypothetical protein
MERERNTTTVVERDRGGSGAMAVALIVVALLVGLLAFYALSNRDGGVVPNEIDVNINQPGAPAQEQPAQPVQPAPGDGGGEIDPAPPGGFLFFQRGWS